MKGYLDARIVKAVVFWVITVSLVTTILCSILMVWWPGEIEDLRRAVISAALLAFGSIAFQGLNLVFGAIESRHEPRVMLQATQVGETLRKAKESARGETGHAA